MKTHLMCALALAGIFASGLPAADQEIPAITHEELMTALAEKRVILIDANGTASYLEAHIPGAIDYQTNHAKLAKLLPADKSALVVTYCAHEHCGAFRSAADVALGLGYKNVKHYAPGIQGWRTHETIAKN